MLQARIAGFSKDRHKGFWETVAYLGQVERDLGFRAVLFELELQRAMDSREMQELSKPKM